MAVEEGASSRTNSPLLPEETTKNPNPSPMRDENDDPEEGEIVDPENDSSSQTSAAQKHALEHSWTFWFDSPSAKAAMSKKEDWGNSIRPIYTFSTVEEFWGIYNNIRHPSKLTQGIDLHCFKNKVEPKWEDPVCANGGKWTMSFSKVKTDHAWLHTLLALIGEQFDHGDEICGAVVNIRRQDRVAIWTKNAANEAAQLSIGKQWKSFLDSNENIGFIFHEDAMRHEKSAKNRYTV